MAAERDASPRARRTAGLVGVLALALAAVAVPAVAAPLCTGARVKLAEAEALREQARQEAYAGNRDRTCDTLDEATDRTEDARDILEDCGRPVVAIDLRTQLRDLRHLKRFNGCG